MAPGAHATGRLWGRFSPDLDGRGQGRPVSFLFLFLEGAPLALPGRPQPGAQSLRFTPGGEPNAVRV